MRHFPQYFQEPFLPGKKSLNISMLNNNENIINFGIADAIAQGKTDQHPKKGAPP
jgi:hypothetical protein